MDSSVSAYKDAYLQAAYENIGLMSDTVEQLLENPSNSEALTTLFIKSHSLKGQSMTMGFSGIAKSALVIERYTRPLKDANQPVNKDFLPTIKNAIEQMKKSLDSVKSNDKEAPLSSTITTLEKTLGVTV